MSNNQEFIDFITNLAVEERLKVGLKAKEAMKCYKLSLMFWGVCFMTSLYFVNYSFSFEEVPDDKDHTFDYSRLHKHLTLQ